jgi:hypothetical protein
MAKRRNTSNRQGKPSGKAKRLLVAQAKAVIKVRQAQDELAGARLQLAKIESGLVALGEGGQSADW